VLNERDIEMSGFVQNVENLVTSSAYRVLLDPAYALQALDLIVNVAPELYVISGPIQLTSICSPQTSDRKLLKISILEQLEDTPV
jgi:hypothetical protein